MRTITTSVAPRDGFLGTQHLAALAQWVHARGVAIEAALGVVSGKEGLVTNCEGMPDPKAAERWSVGETRIGFVHRSSVHHEEAIIVSTHGIAQLSCCM